MEPAHTAANAAADDNFRVPGGRVTLFLFCVKVPETEYVKVTAANMMNAGMKNIFWGMIFTRDTIRAWPGSRLYMIPLQNPAEKHLYHRSRGGTGHRYFVNTAGSMSSSMSMFTLKKDSSECMNPDGGDAEADRISSDSLSVFSADRPVL